MDSTIKIERNTMLKKTGIVVLLLGSMIFVVHAPTQVIFAQNDNAPSDTIKAQRHFQRGDILLKEFRYDSSRIYFEKASCLYEQSAIWDKYVQCLNKISENYSRENQLDSALNFANKSLSVGLDKLGEKHPEIANCYLNIGKAYFHKNDFDKALQFHQKALVLTLEVLGTNHTNTANIYDVIGYVYHNIKDIDKAFQFYQKALSIRLAILDEMHPDVATSYNNMGAIYSDKGNYDKSRQYFEKALSIRLATLGEKHPDVATSYSNIGTSYLNYGDYDKAIEYFQKALSITLSRSGKKNSSIALCYYHFGNTYSNKGDYDKALEYYQKALSIFFERYSNMQNVISECYTRIGNLYYYKDVYDKALQFFQKALSIEIPLFGEKYPGVAMVYTGIGSVYLKTGDCDKALLFFQKSLSIDLEAFSEKHFAVFGSYYNMGDVYLKKNNPSEALKYFQKSIISLTQDFKDTSISANPILKNISSEPYLIISLESKAEAFEKLYATKSKNIKDLINAESTYELASDLISKMMKDKQSESSKFNLGKMAFHINDKAISTSLLLYRITNNDKYKEKAFTFSERNKASVLIQALLESKAKQFAGIPGDLLEKERDLKIDLAFYEKSLFEEQANGKKAVNSKMMLFQDKLFSLNREYEALTQRFENEYPEYYNLKYKTYTISPKEIQAKLLNKDNALIEYFTGDSSIYIFTITQHTFDVAKVQNDTLFDEQINSMREGLIKRKYDLYIDNAYRLYERLIEPVKSTITNKNLIIIPDGILGYIPFETLLTKQPDSKNKDYRQLAYLIKDYQITYDYSATLLFENETSGKKKSESRYIGFAPVTFK